MSVLSPTLMSPEAAARRPWLEHAHDWVVTVDHKRLGILYVVSGLVFFVVAGIEATLMRLQLAWPGLHIVPPETFNRLFTMHGTSMVFLVGIFFLGSVQLLFIGIIGEYIGSIYTQVQHRPLVIEKERINFDEEAHPVVPVSAAGRRP